MNDGRPELERIARRAARRRQVRRRRVVVITAVGGLAVVLSASALVARGGGEDTGAGTTAGMRRSTSASTPARRSPSSVHARSRLGSGKSVTLAFGGDVHFESPIRELLATSPASVLAPIAPMLRRADIAMLNLETAVTEGGTRSSKEYVFRAPASAFDALSAGGLDVVSVANNHGMDFGESGLLDTLASARRAGLPLVGAGVNDAQAYAPFRRTIRGQRIAIISATQVLDDHLVSAWSAGPGKVGLASAKNEPRLLRAVREARTSSDTLVVFLHWGVELAGCPTSSQKSLSRKLIAAGADIVVGSHAHVLLGAGRRGKALVAYGLGNFVFYASRAETTATGVLEVTATGRRVDGYRWVPARISGGIPYPLTGSERGQAQASWRALRSCTDLRR